MKNELEKQILKEYASIIIDRGDEELHMLELESLLEILDGSTKGDILVDLKAYKKTVV